MPLKEKRNKELLKGKLLSAILKASIFFSFICLLIDSSGGWDQITKCLKWHSKALKAFFFFFPVANVGSLGMTQKNLDFTECKRVFKDKRQ